VRSPATLPTTPRLPLTLLLTLAGCALLGFGLAGGSLLGGSVASASLGGRPNPDPTPRRLDPEAAAPLVSAAGPTPRPTATPVPPSAVVQPAIMAGADLQATPPAPDPARPSWVTNTRETGLWSGPSDGTLYSKLPTGEIFRVLDLQAGRFRVFYPGDRAQRAPGEAWVDRTDLVGIAWPRWVRLRSAGTIMARPAPTAAGLRELKAGDYIEVVGEARGDWAQVFYLGDGRASSVDGWLEAGPTVPIPGPEVASTFATSRDLLKGGPEPWIKLPYHSQMDGTPWSLANCGPTTIGMVLEGFGFQVTPVTLRQEALALQQNEDCNDCGVYIQNLAEVVSRRGLKVNNLRDADPEAFHRWTLDEIRAELQAGRPVVPQVFYRKLPGRATSAYYGDHFVVLTGLLDDRIVFNDPIDVEGPGYSRLITPQALDQAMAGADYPYAAFSVTRAGS
jgi:Peptidase_C39 like family